MNSSLNYNVIGLMSGTSLDGIDLAYVNFSYDKKWMYKILECETYSYDLNWFNLLQTLHLESEKKISKINEDYGKFLANIIDDFISKNNLNVDLICSHGHTVLHQPEKKITVQIGCGKTIQKQLRIPVVCDFRSLDVKLGGQGAPLVPVGDELLFNQYDYCLNLGGFSNFSYQKDNERKAYDICPVNIVFNKYANKLERKFDKNGELAKQGIVNENLLKQLNNLDYYKIDPPKSLAKEWLEKNFIPIIDSYNDSEKNNLRTLVEHAAIQIGSCIKNGKCLVTGGGAFNSFLIERMKQNSNANFILSNKKLIEYKEAMIFGLLGVLRKENQINCLSSVTGAQRDSCTGTLYL